MECAACGIDADGLDAQVRKKWRLIAVADDLDPDTPRWDPKAEHRSQGLHAMHFHNLTALQCSQTLVRRSNLKELPLQVGGQLDDRAVQGLGGK